MIMMIIVTTMIQVLLIIGQVFLWSQVVRLLLRKKHRPSALNIRSIIISSQDEVGRLYLNTNDTDVINLFPAGWVLDLPELHVLKLMPKNLNVEMIARLKLCSSGSCSDPWPCGSPSLPPPSTPTKPQPTKQPEAMKVLLTTFPRPSTYILHLAKHMQGVPKKNYPCGISWEQIHMIF